MASSRSFGERVRRNHALEHATLHVLAREMPDLSLVGRSDGHGFLLYGEVDAESVRLAAQEALERLRNGESYLRVHQNCGTNLAVGLVLAGTAFLVGFLGSRREHWRRWPLTFLGLAGATTLAAPLGPEVQRRWTTDADMTGVSVHAVRLLGGGRIPALRVEIEHTDR
jgi:hypothetical protein